MRPTRFERATYGFEVRCSIQLSYRRMFFVKPFTLSNERLAHAQTKIGCLMGFEPTTTRSTIWRSTTELQAPCVTK